MATSVETPGADLTTRTKQLGAKEKSRSTKVRGEILTHQEKKQLPEKLHEDGCEKVAKDGLGPCESVERPSSWNGAYGKAHVEETNGLCSRQEGIGVALTHHRSELSVS